MADFISHFSIFVKPVEMTSAPQVVDCWSMSRPSRIKYGEADWITSLLPVPLRVTFWPLADLICIGDLIEIFNSYSPPGISITVNGWELEMKLLSEVDLSYVT